MTAQPPAGGMTIVVPGSPDKRLSINAARRTHYMAKAGISRQARHDAFWATKSQVEVSGDHPRFSGPVRVTQCVYWGKGQRSVDLDTIAAMCKPYLDGITDAGSVWADDRQIVELTVRQGRDAGKSGYVAVFIEDAAER